MHIAAAAVLLQAAAARVKLAADARATMLPAAPADAVLLRYPHAVRDVLCHKQMLGRTLVESSRGWTVGDGNFERWAAPLFAAVVDGLVSFAPLPHSPGAGAAAVVNLLPHVEAQAHSACWLHGFHAVLGGPLGGLNAGGLYHLLAHVVERGDGPHAWTVSRWPTRLEGIINAWHNHNPIFHGLFDTQLSNVALLLNPATVGSRTVKPLSVPYLGYVRVDDNGDDDDVGGDVPAAGVGVGTTPLGRLLDTVAARLHSDLLAASAPVGKAGKKKVVAVQPAAAVAVADVHAAITQLIVMYGHRSGKSGGGIGHFVTVQLAPAVADGGGAGSPSGERLWLLTDSAADHRVQLLREGEFSPLHPIFTAAQRGVLAFALPVEAAARAPARVALWRNIQAVLTTLSMRSLGPDAIPAADAASAAAAEVVEG